MFDFVQNNKRILHFVLILLIVPSFAFWGISQYFNSSTDNVVAHVGKQKITPKEFAEALEQRQNQVREALKGKVDNALLDSQDFRSRVLDDLVRQRLLLQHADSAGIVITDNQLAQAIQNQSAFQVNKQFSPELYHKFLEARGFNEATFDQLMRQDMAPQAVAASTSNTAIVSQEAVNRILLANAEQRETSYVLVLPDPYLAQSAPDDAAIKKFYDEHNADFQAPENAHADYLALTLEDVAAGMAVSADEARSYYNAHAAQYGQNNERRASHILITVDAKADAATKAAARAKAEALAQELKAHPGRFAELARKESQDPGSAAKGGDLGWFPHGAMVKPFEDALTALKPGEITGPVETQYGYHVIRLDAERGGSFEDARARVEADMRRDKARQKFADMGYQLNNLAYENNDSLKPAADALKLAVRHSGLITRNDVEDAVINNEKLRKAIFSDDVLKAKHNTEVIDVGNDTLVVARVTAYEPAHLRPLEEVKADIVKTLTQQEASRRAEEAGKKMLAQLQAGDVTGAAADLKWNPPRPVSRSNPQGIPPQLISQIFQVNAAKLPGYAGAPYPRGGFVLLKVTQVTPGQPDPQQRDALAAQLRQGAGQAELEAFVAALKAAADIKVDTQLMLGKAPAGSDTAPGDSAPAPLGQ